MKDRNNNILIPECTLRSEKFGSGSTEITYKGDDTFECPGGGYIYHDQESLLKSFWVVTRYPQTEQACPLGVVSNG